MHGSGNLYLSLIQVQDQTMSGHGFDDTREGRSWRDTCTSMQHVVDDKDDNRQKYACDKFRFIRRCQASDSGVYWNAALKLMSTAHIMRFKSLE